MNELEKTKRTMIIVTSISVVAVLGLLSIPAIIYDGLWINALFTFATTALASVLTLLGAILASKKSVDSDVK